MLTNPFQCGRYLCLLGQVTKRVWAYIKEHGLQNPNDRRQILCDAKLETLFKKKSIAMFKMTKELSQMMKSVRELQDGPIAKASSSRASSVKTETSSKQSKNSKSSRKEVVPRAKGACSLNYIKKESISYLILLQVASPHPFNLQRL